MESQPLKDYLRNKSKQKRKATDDHAPKPWYNVYGDCIEYQTEQVAIVADRIDNFLTIYRSGDTDNPIGFQLKDVKALMKKYHASSAHVMCGFKDKDKKIVSVISLLLTALEAELPLSIKKRDGYFEAIRNFAEEKDDVSLEESLESAV